VSRIGRKGSGGRRRPKSRKASPSSSHPVAAEVTDIILESISDGVFTVDGDWRITSFNRAAERITGIPRKDALGRPCSEVFRSSLCETGCALRRTTETGEAVVGRPASVVDAQGRRVPVSISTALLRDARGRVVGGVETFRDLSQIEELRKELESSHSLGDMVGRSRAMQRLFGILPQLAASESTVLIQGATGTGKELVARALHDLSPRRDGPFVAVSCGALPEALLESELFGYEAGAFTGAVKDKPGRFALAEGGTLLLDEIGEVSPATQVKLLRVLQEKTYEPLGSTEARKADVRVLAATNRDLAALVKEGRFRQDLFYRVHVVPLEVPPLRERKEDIPLLVEHFVGRLNRLQDRAVEGVSPEALGLLMACDWPGNVRELENAIEHAFVLCREGLIEPGHLSEDFRARAPGATQPGKASATLRETEARMIMEALRRNGFNRLATARELDIHKSTLFRKIKALDLELPRKDGRSGRSEAAK